MIRYEAEVRLVARDRRAADDEAGVTPHHFHGFTIWASSCHEGCILTLYSKPTPANSLSSMQ